MFPRASPSSMMLMPPQKPMRPSTTASFRCSRRSRVRLNLERRQFRAEHQQLHARFQKLPAQALQRNKRDPKPSTIRCTITPRRAARMSAAAIAFAGVVRLEYVGLQEDLACCGIDFTLERREVLLDRCAAAEIRLPSRNFMPSGSAAPTTRCGRTRATRRVHGGHGRCGSRNRAHKCGRDAAAATMAG